MDNDDRTHPEYELTPGVVSQTPDLPGSLYLMVTLFGDTIVLTPVGSAGSCLLPYSRFLEFRT